MQLTIVFSQFTQKDLMKHFLLALLLVILSFSPFSGYAGHDIEVPHEVAGIKLGEDIADYQDIEYSNYLKEVIVNDWHGFRKGIIYYGVCDSPGIIVKLRMKYEDNSKDFFNNLMKRFKKKFGPPTEWKGDSFGIKHIWKWKFRDKEGRSVSMSLQHNLKDPNNSIGNEVKMSYPEQIELERLCFIRQCEQIESPEEQKRREKLKETGWDYLIPK